MRFVSNAFVCVAALAMLTACEKNGADQPPQTASSTEHVRYAEDYPDEIGAASTKITKGQTEVTDRTSKFESYPAQIKDPTDYGVVVEVVRAADESGRSQAYVERAQENEAILGVFEENDGQVKKTIAGSVGYAAKQQGCDEAVGGAAIGAMNRALDKRMAERLTERNRAYEVIEHNKSKLGDKNVKPLQTQSDDIAYASYVAFIQLPTARSELQRLVDERSDVESTIDDAVEREKAFQASEGVDDKAKKASEKRVEELEKSKADLAAAQTYDQAQLQQLDADIQAAQDGYNNALDKLIDDYNAKGGNAPAPAAGADVKASTP